MSKQYIKCPVKRCPCRLEVTKDPNTNWLLACVHFYSIHPERFEQALDRARGMLQ